MILLCEYESLVIKKHMLQHTNMNSLFEGPVLVMIRKQCLKAIYAIFLVSVRT